MPWVRLHALKDYYDMAAYIEQVPGTRAVINLVPSLLEQLQSYVDGASDFWLDIAGKPAGELSQTEQLFVLRNFLGLHAHSLVSHIPRYRQLQKLRAIHPEPERPERMLSHFNEQKIRDVIVLFHLAWCGETLKEDPLVKRLISRGGDFSEQDKDELLEVQRKFLPRVLEIHRRLHAAGTIELSTTPFFHPILPLLINTESGREQLPNAPFPEKKFSYPEDAALQVQLAQEYLQKELNLQGSGMWPSEGALSRDTCELACTASVPWLASDEDVLRNSLALDVMEARQLYRAYQYKGREGNVSLFFRDHALSDLIGFELATVPFEKAVDRFMKKLGAVYDSLPGDKAQFVVPVILDGENAWEHYENNGRDFLTRLYHALDSDDRFQMSTFKNLLADDLPKLPLAQVRAGSWIYGTLSTWIGQEEKNRGWSYLSRTRLFYEQTRRSGKHQPDILLQMQRAMLAAEGSDWFWWYGEDHHTDHPEEFDRLFRHNQQQVYRLAGEEIPTFLKEPVFRRRQAKAVEPPVQVIHPSIDGCSKDYFEWLAAGKIVQRYSAIHRDQALVSAIRFGVDSEHFYLRVDFNSDLKTPLPDKLQVALEFDDLEEEILLDPKRQGAFFHTEKIGECRQEVVLEASVELDRIQVPRDIVSFRVRINSDAETLEVLPNYGSAEVDLDAKRVRSENWFV